MSQKWVRTSGVFLGAIAVVAIVLAWAPWNAADSDSAKAGGEVGATAPASSDSASICGLADGDQSIPTTSGPAVEWDLVGRIAAPASPDVLGPGSQVDGVRTCYAKSPAGALLAAANFTAQASTPDLALRNAETNMAAGAGRDVVVAALQSSTPGGSDSLSVQIAGFKFIEFKGETTLVEIVARGSNGALVSSPMNMVWQDGDWKLSVQDNGQALVPPREIPSLSGYVLWSGA